MKKRISSKDIELGYKVFMALREAVPDDDMTIGQAIIGAEMFISECYVEILSAASDAPAEWRDAKLKELIEIHTERLGMFTRIGMAHGRKMKAAGAQGERREDVSDAEA